MPRGRSASSVIYTVGNCYRIVRLFSNGERPGRTSRVLLPPASEVLLSSDATSRERTVPCIVAILLLAPLPASNAAPRLSLSAWSSCSFRLCLAASSCVWLCLALLSGRCNSRYTSSDLSPVFVDHGQCQTLPWRRTIMNRFALVRRSSWTSSSANNVRIHANVSD